MGRLFYVICLWLGLSLWGMAEGQTDDNTTSAIGITLSGNKDLESSAYLNALGVEQRSWFQFWKEDKREIETKKIPQIQETLQAFLDAKGYYDAKISVVKTPKGVSIHINEGKPVRVSEIVLESDFNLSDTVTFEKNSRFEVQRFIDIKAAIKKALMKAGYCNYMLDTKAYVDLDKHGVVLHYKVSKGELCYFGETVIKQKPENISEKVIRSRLRYKKGEVFSTEKINRTFGALNSLDAFGSGTVSPQEKEIDEETFDEESTPTKPSAIVPMEISLAPKAKQHVFKGGIGYDTALGMRLQLYYERRNFMGEARKFTSTLHYSDKSQFGEMTLFSPALIRWSGEYFDLHSRLGFAHSIYDAYDENRGYWDIKLSYERDQITAEIGMGLENIDIQKTEDVPSIISGNFLLFYPFARFIYDGRDSKINPKNGYYFSVYTEYGLDYKPDASSYLKFLLEGRLIKTLDDLTLAAVAKVGVIDEYAGVVPASKLFYAGGAYSNRAYGEHELGYLTSEISSSPLGGKSWFNMTFEAAYPLYEKLLYGALFWDSTMLNKDAYDFDGVLHHTVGAGVRYMSPIGPIKLDVGVNIHDIKQYGISFQIGQSF